MKKRGRLVRNLTTVLSGFRPASLAFAPFFLLSCQLPALPSPSQSALNFAQTNNLQAVRIPAEGFSILALYKPGPTRKKILSIYIEGDGLAWRNRWKVSDDPTPKDLLVLKMMVQDPSPNKLYLGRPCQHAQTKKPACHSQYWTSHRLAPITVAAMNQAIDTMKQRLGAERIVLIGYSGGGSMATLLAAIRSDVGNGRPVFWSGHVGKAAPDIVCLG